MTDGKRGKSLVVGEHPCIGSDGDPRAFVHRKDRVMTKRLTCVCLVALFAGLGCPRKDPSPEEETADASSVVQDASIQGVDGSAGTPDAGQTVSDASVTQLDAAATVDASVQLGDAGERDASAMPDANTVADAGQQVVDSGSQVADAATQPADSGTTPQGDAGEQPQGDAGEQPQADAGQDRAPVAVIRYNTAQPTGPSDYPFDAQNPPAAAPSAGTTVYLSATSSSDPDAEALTFAWVVTGPNGQGVTVQGQPWAAEVSFVLNQPGAFVVKLTAREPHGLEGVQELTISVPGCIPQCDGKVCGLDGCGSTCGLGCTTTQTCTVDGQCVNDYQPTWVTIPAGWFIMGSPESELNRRPEEGQHKVTLTRSFKMWSTEVTQGEFSGLMGYNPSVEAGCGMDCAVENVSWDESAAFCNALSLRDSLAPCYNCNGSLDTVECSLNTLFQSPYDCPGYRLPTEAEWEYAARAGTTSATYNGNCDEAHQTYEQPNPVLDPIAWFDGNSGEEPHPVALKLPNAFGLYDMLGGVFEWCVDEKIALGSSDTVDPWGGSDSPEPQMRVQRGGSWFHWALQSRAAFRPSIIQSEHDKAGGFRIVQTVTQD